MIEKIKICVAFEKSAFENEIFFDVKEFFSCIMISKMGVYIGVNEFQNNNEK